MQFPNRNLLNNNDTRDTLCALCRFGQKTNAGYYDYEFGSRTPVPSKLVEEGMKEIAARHNILQRMISDNEILDRSLYSGINESAKILEEGIAIRPGHIDVVRVNGYGWPVYQGGPMFYADSIGLDTVYDRVKHFEEGFGSTRKP